MTITLQPDASLADVSILWRKTIPTVERMRAGEHLSIDANQVEACNGAMAAFVLQITHLAETKKLQLELQDSHGSLQSVLKTFPPAEFLDGQNGKIVERKSGLLLQLGHAASNIWDDLTAQMSFLGEVTQSFVQAIFHPRSFRFKDMFLCFERAGMDALPITLLIGFLLGLILAFMSAASLRQFGVEIFVADLIAIGLFRELGPIITAIILAGRSGSAFAAEIGTMKVNEELDALTTFGLSPVQFLALPRIIAAAGVMPILTIFSILAGLIGGCLVLMPMGVPAVTYWNHVISSTSLQSVLFGLGKSLVFGILVGLIGCSFGVRTGRTADAVGRAATASVVGSLVFITFFDGIFAVFSYLVGI